MLVCENQHPRFVSLIYKCPVNKAIFKSQLQSNLAVLPRGIQRWLSGDAFGFSKTF